MRIHNTFIFNLIFLMQTSARCYNWGEPASACTLRWKMTTFGGLSTISDSWVRRLAAQAKFLSWWMAESIASIWTSADARSMLLMMMITMMIITATMAMALTIAITMTLTMKMTVALTMTITLTVMITVRVWMRSAAFSQPGWVSSGQESGMPNSEPPLTEKWICSGILA